LARFGELGDGAEVDPVLAELDGVEAAAAGGGAVAGAAGAAAAQVEGGGEAAGAGLGRRPARPTGHGWGKRSRTSWARVVASVAW
jgi:hypothetical protein